MKVHENWKEQENRKGAGELEVATKLEGAGKHEEAE